MNIISQMIHFLPKDLNRHIIKPKIHTVLQISLLVFTLYWCGKKYNFYQTEHFHCPKNPLCSVYPPSSPQQPLTFLLSPQFQLSQNGMQLESCNIWSIQIFFFHLVISIQVFSLNNSITHFLSLNNTPLSGEQIFSSLAQSHLGCF